jgi:hypothetical protein
MRSNAKFGARLFDWYERMMACLEQLSEAELRDLRDWEASPAFTKTGDWAGWLPHIGPRPGKEQQHRPALVRRRA